MSDTSEVLFPITRGHLDTGLRGFPVGTCYTSTVDPIKGVAYVGYPIADLYDLEPEAVVYLLLNKELPNDEQLAAFKADMSARQGLPQSVLDGLKALPKDGHPMEWLIAGLTLMGMTTKTGNWKEDCLNLIARSHELVAAIFRIRSGWGDPIAPSKELGFAENFTRMLGVPDADPKKLGQLLGNFYILHLDHGGGNLSTFVGKAVASGHADMYASIGAAMAALYGPLHGRANQDCLNFVREVGTADEGAVEAFIRNKLETGGKIYGFGHAVLRAEDARAAIQYELGEKLFPNDPLFQVAKALRKVGVRVLSSIEKIQNPYPNVDAVSGTLLQAAGLLDSNYYTVLFGWSRIAGIAAQIVDERTKHRDGKGVAIYRPKYIGVNQPARSRKG